MKKGNLMKKISNEIQILAETLTLPKVVIEQMIVQAKTSLMRCLSNIVMN